MSYSIFPYMKRCENPQRSYFWILIKLSSRKYYQNATEFNSFVPVIKQRVDESLIDIYCILRQSS